MNPGYYQCGYVYTATYAPSTDVSYYSEKESGHLFTVDFSASDRAALTTLTPAEQAERDVAITITVAPEPAWRAA
mgnify:CR=1 FL=1